MSVGKSEAAPTRALVLAAAGLVFVACLATAPLVPLFDPDEGYYPATAYESQTYGSAWDPRFDGGPRWDKPVLTYLSIQASFAVFGPSVTAARVPDAVIGALLVLVVGLFVERLAGDRAGALSAMVLASSLGMQVFARAAHPEITVVSSIVATELLLCRWFLDPAGPRASAVAALIGVVAGIGVLAKGPVAVVLPLLTLAAAWAVLRRQSPSWRRALVDATIAVAVAIAVAAPWYIAMTMRHGWSFLEESLWKHNVVRYTTSEFGHGGTPLFFVLPTLALLLPWSGFLGGLFARNPTITSARHTLRVFMAASAITAFLFYSASGSKLVNYALVLVPPIAVLIGLRLDALLDRDARRSVDERVASVFVALLAVAILLVPVAIANGVNARPLVGGAPERGTSIAMLVWPATTGVGLTLLGAAAVSGLVRSRRRRIVAFVVSGFAAPLLLLVLGRPLLTNAYPWQRFGEQVRGRTGQVWLYGYRAPSLTFYARRPVRGLTNPEELAEVMHGEQEGWLVIERDQWERLRRPDATADVADSGGRMVLVHVTGD